MKRLTIVQGDLPPPPELPRWVSEFYASEPVEPAWNPYEEKAIGRDFRQNIQGCSFWGVIIPVAWAVVGFLLHYEAVAWWSLIILALYLLIIGSLYFASVRISHAKYKATFNEASQRYREAYQNYQEQKREHHTSLLIQQKELEDRKHVYGRRKPLWDQLFYCQRDGSYFLPGSFRADPDPLALIDSLLSSPPNTATQ